MWGGAGPFLRTVIHIADAMKRLRIGRVCTTKCTQLKEADDFMKSKYPGMIFSLCYVGMVGFSFLPLPEQNSQTENKAPKFQ